MNGLTTPEAYSGTGGTPVQWLSPGTVITAPPPRRGASASALGGAALVVAIAVWVVAASGWPGYEWVFLLATLPVACLVSPHEGSGFSRAIYWLFPPIVSFLGFVVLERNLGGALALGAVALGFMGCLWFRDFALPKLFRR